MTPEMLKAVEAYLAEGQPLAAEPARLLAEEVRRLWAERDARQVVGGPVSEERLCDIRHATENKHWNDSTHEMALDLLQHVAFLEQLLLDGDDLLAVRKTGYRDGWRAAMAKAVEVVIGGYPEADLMPTYRDDIATLRKLAEEGPP